MDIYAMVLMLVAAMVFGMVAGLIWRIILFNN
jgi:hypothetical protein